MSGHGWVNPNADGSKAPCGGPGICRECQQEVLGRKDKNDFGFLTVLYNYIGPEHIDAAKKRCLLLKTKEYLQLRFELEGVPGQITMVFDGRPIEKIRAEARFKAERQKRKR